MNVRRDQPIGKLFFFARGNLSLIITINAATTNADILVDDARSNGKPSDWGKERV